MQFLSRVRYVDEGIEPVFVQVPESDRYIILKHKPGSFIFDFYNFLLCFAQACIMSKRMKEPCGTHQGISYRVLISALWRYRCDRSIRRAQDPRRYLGSSGL
jgi:hypothetical protein